MNLIEINKRRFELRDELKGKLETFQQDKKRIEKEVSELNEKEAFYLGGIDPEKIALGRSVIDVSGQLDACVNGRDSDQVRTGGRQQLVNEAIEDLVNGPVKMRTEYFGMKNYSGFGDQRSDHSYYMGPRHGSIVFSVGLKTSRLKDDFTTEEIEAAIYYLRNLKEVQSAKQAA